MHEMGYKFYFSLTYFWLWNGSRSFFDGRYLIVSKSSRLFRFKWLKGKIWEIWRCGRVKYYWQKAFKLKKKLKKLKILQKNVKKFRRTERVVFRTGNQKTHLFHDVLTYHAVIIFNIFVGGLQIVQAFYKIVNWPWRTFLFSVC